MSQVFSNLFGGGARRAAQESAARQEVANTRQLNALNSAEQRDGTTRRRPRGRRLFSDAGPSNLPSNLS